jgi:NADPH:quinone reductase-like Zn-dependent oxidoreductase
MPDETEFPEMACVPIAGVTALQAIVTHGKLQSGESVLINGSSGGVGHFTVQVAKAYGAEVTAVCSSRNVDFAKELGADQILAYDKVDIHKHKGRYDLIVDTHGNLTHNDFTRMGKRAIIVGFTSVGHMMGVMLGNSIRRFPLKQFTAHPNTEDLETLAGLISEKKIRVHIERTYTHLEIPEAIGSIESMRTRGKVAMVWENP